MQFIPEILKIIEGGIKSNTTQVTSYAKLLADKMEREGMERAARNIRKKLEIGPSKTLGMEALGGQNTLPVDKDSRLTLGDETFPVEDEQKIKLSDNINSVIHEFISFIEKAHLLEEAGVGVTPSMLIYGPPGCGKTKLANHLAAKLQLPLVTARCDTLISSFLGSTAKNIRSLFDHAASKPCVLFLDEFDAFAKARDDQHELGELKRVVVSLLQNIDALPEGTILIAATNHEELLDPAVWRRFAYRIQIPLPDSETREKLLAQFLGDFGVSNMKALVDLTEGMSGALIEQACKAEIRNAILNGSNKVNSEQLIIKLISDLYQETLRSDKRIEDKVLELRGLNKKLFTMNRLSALLGISVGKISKITSNKD